jgi:CHAD domain-containing protein
VLLAYLRKQTEALKAMDVGVREGEPDAVHKFRVATRRMRSSLATYRKLADRAAGDRLRVELKRPRPPSGRPGISGSCASGSRPSLPPSPHSC